LQIYTYIMSLRCLTEVLRGGGRENPGEAGGLSLPPPPKTPTGLCDGAGLYDGARLLNGPGMNWPGPIFTPHVDFGHLGPRLTPTWHMAPHHMRCSESRKAIKKKKSLLKTKTNYKNIILKIK
jgi:hypothetical protein